MSETEDQMPIRSMHTAEEHLAEVGPPEHFVFASEVEAMIAFARQWLDEAAQNIHERGMREAATVVRRLKEKVR